METNHIPYDRLSATVDEIEQAVAQADYKRVHLLFVKETPTLWFGLQTHRYFEILQILVENYPDTHPITQACYAVLRENASNSVDITDLLAKLDPANPREAFFLALLRAYEGRVLGKPGYALENAERLMDYLVRMTAFATSNSGWELHIPIQIGVSALLAGDFTRALTAFTQARLHPPIPAFAFLTRDALIKSALIHAVFGNMTSAKPLLERSRDIPRTSSWVEAHIDSHTDMASLLIESTTSQDALERLHRIDLHTVGELWPIYVIITYRLFDALGRHDELAHQLDMFDAMPLPKNDREGLSGSIIPLKKALLALNNGRLAEAEKQLQRASPTITYTRVIQAATQLYARRPRQAIQETLALHDETRGFRHLEVQRISILATAHHMMGDHDNAIQVLEHAAQLPGGLAPNELVLFNHDLQALATRHVPSWPVHDDVPAFFLSNLPKPGVTLTERESQILKLLAQGLTRPQISHRLYVSLNTVKSQISSIYRKLCVTSRDDAIYEAQSHYLI